VAGVYQAKTLIYQRDNRDGTAWDNANGESKLDVSRLMRVITRNTSNENSDHLSLSAWEIIGSSIDFRIKSTRAIL